MVGDEQCGHLRLVEPHAHPVAGGSRLGHLELGVADAVPVTDAHLVVGQPVDGEVLAEDAAGQVRATQVLTPVLVGLGLVDHHGALLAAVPGQIALPVAVQIQPAGHDRAGHRLLPDAGVDDPAVPGDVAGKADVHRQQRRHAAPPLLRTMDADSPSAA